MVWMQRGGPVMWPLLVLSMWAATVVVERLLFWSRERRRPAAQVIDELVARGTRELGPASELELLLDAEQRRLERGMGTLDTIFAAAPMLGILGTVLGVIGAFDSLAARANPDPMAVTGGISEALITTASGLVIALAVLFPYGVFRARIGLRLSELDASARSQLASRGAAPAGE